MMLFDACAVRAIVTAVTLLVGLSTPSIILDQTTQLLSQKFSSDTVFSTALSDLPSQDSLLIAHSINGSSGMATSLPQLLSIFSEFEHLEIDLLSNVTAISVHSLPIANESSEMATLLPQLHSCGLEHLQIDPISEITIHALPGLTSYTDIGSFKTTSLLPQLIFSEFEPLLEFEIAFPQTHDSGCLATLKQLRLYVRELILHSLPTHWAELITHNRLTLGLVCLSVMCGSLLCPILHYLWTVIKANKCQSKDLKSLNGLKLCVESQLQRMIMEINALVETNRVHRKELKDTKTRLRQSQVLEIETTDELALVAKEFYLEQKNVRENMEHIKSEHVKALAKVNRKLEDAKRQVSWYQIYECKAKMEVASFKKQVEEERMERNNKKLSTSQLMTELQQELRTTRRTLKGNLETTQQKLRLAVDKALELKLRLADSVMNHSEMGRKDSGIFVASWD